MKTAAELAQLALLDRRYARSFFTAQQAQLRSPNALGTFAGYQDGKALAQLPDGGVIPVGKSTNTGVQNGSAIAVARIDEGTAIGRWQS